MLRKVKTAVLKNTRPYHLAGLFTLAFFAAGLSHKTNPDLLTRHLIYTGIMFLCAWVGCRLFTDGVQRRIRLEGVAPGAAGDMITTFVLYLEIIKHVVGVSFTLGWIAGVMACWDFLGGRMLMVPVTASLAVSLTAFLVTFGFSSFVDQLRWPAKDDE
jgi:uncharacterized membrane protein